MFFTITFLCKCGSSSFAVYQFKHFSGEFVVFEDFNVDESTTGWISPALGEINSLITANSEANLFLVGGNKKTTWKDVNK